MRSRLVPALLLLALAAPAAASDVRVGWQNWGYSIDGTVDTRGERIDLERDIGIEVRDKNTFDLRFDHEARWLPDLAANYQHIDAGGQRTVTSGGIFGPSESTTLADADLRDMEVTLRWPLRREAFSAWGGVTVKQLDGDLTTRTEGQTAETRESVSQVFPLVHGAVEYMIGSHVTLGGRVDWISAGEDSALQWRAGVEAWLVGPLGVSAAWQQRRYEVSTDNDRLDATLGGALLGVFLRFK